MGDDDRYTRSHPDFLQPAGRALRGQAESAETGVTELRLIIECGDWDQALAFYRDALGLRQMIGYKGGVEGQMLLDVGRATIELVHPVLPPVDSTAPVDLSAPQVPKTRLEFRTARAQTLVGRLEAAGAIKVRGPILSASETLTVRTIAPDNMPITVFRAMGETEFAEAPE